MPAAVMSVAGTALGPSASSAIARVATAEGAWITLQGTRLDGPAGRQAAVVIEAAQPKHLAGILMRIHGLTDREQQVTRLVIRGASTTAVARQLDIAEDTVQKHLQGVFGKTGTRSRGELVSLLFQTHYEPRVRDNELRRSTTGPPGTAQCREPQTPRAERLVGLSPASARNSVAGPTPIDVPRTRNEERGRLGRGQTA